MRTPQPGDRVLIDIGGKIPVPAVVTRVQDGNITLVRPTGPWLVFGGDQFAVEGWPPDDGDGRLLLFDATSQDDDGGT